MIFANPQYLIGLLLIPATAIFLLWAERHGRKALEKLGDRRLIQKLSANINWRGRRWKTILHLTALALFIIALARPQWGSQTREIEQEGLQVMVALDVSASMLAQDIKPSRLDRAKLEISDMMERLNGDEIGLVLFSGASFIQVPLTTDYNTALAYLDSAQPGVISRPGTVLGDAIRTAWNGYDQELNSQKVLVLMTDGEDHETDPLAAAQELAEKGVLIYTIGFGTPEGEPVPVLDEYGNLKDYKKDQNGEMVLSRLDETTLKEVARIGGGEYYQATAGGSELNSLLSEIDRLQTAQLQSRFETRYIERYQIFLWLALAALLIAEFIPDRKGKRSQSLGNLFNNRQSRYVSKQSTPSWESR